MKKRYIAMLTLILVIMISGCKTDEKASKDSSDKEVKVVDAELEAVKNLFQPLSDVPIPVDNEMTDDKVELGKRLYYDSRLSGDNKQSCMSCHSPGVGYGDGMKTFIGFEGTKGTRNSPTIINSGYYNDNFWDGRAGSLEEQALGPIQSEVEMNQNLDELVTELDAVPGYVDEFNKVFEDKINVSNIAKALAAFQRTIVVKDTAFDKYLLGDDDALTAVEEEGMKLFAGKAGCISCHSGAFLSDQSYHNLGMEDDEGRFAVTNKEEDKGKFRTPGLRGVSFTAPFMHDGSLATLEDVVEYYNEGGGTHVNKSDLVKPLNLSKDEVHSLVAFLEAMSGELPAIETPKMH